MKDSMEFFLQPSCSGIENILLETDQFLKSHGISDGIVHEQIMILEELVKFGTNFGNSGLSQEEIKIKINIDNKSITTEVSKPIKGVRLKHLDKLEETIQFIRGFQDPFEAYMKMKSMHSLQNNNEYSGLGLAKIANTGNAIVDFFINENSIFYLSAVRNFNEDNYILRRSSKIINDQLFRQQL